jgi:hypothetical protein
MDWLARVEQGWTPKLFLDSQIDPAIKLSQLDTPRSKSIGTAAAGFQNCYLDQAERISATNLQDGD